MDLWFININSWYDGCNTCFCTNGEIAGCTRKYCTKYDDSYCKACNDGYELNDNNECIKSTASCGGFENCIKFYDGCNYCFCDEYGIAGCDDMDCERYGDSYCTECDIGYELNADRECVVESCGGFAYCTR